MKPPPTPRDIPYADAAAFLASVLAELAPPLPLSVAAHARAHRWVPAAEGGHLQRWDETVAPYLIAPMEALTEPGIDTIAIVGPGASGKTIVAENRLLHAMHADPAQLLWYMPTEPLAESYVKARIEPMLEAHESLIGHLRHGRDSTGFKRFRGGRVEFLPFTHAALVNKHVQHIIADEFDAFDARLGDPLGVLNPRRQAALEAGAHSTLLLISHPDLGLPLTAPIERQRGILRVYLSGDRRTFWWQCPHCGSFSSPTPGASRRMVLHVPDGASPEEAEDKARLLCPSGCLITDAERLAMLRGTTRWICAGQTMDEDGTVHGTRTPNRVAGFWITGIMSPFTKGGLGGLARARVQAEREAAGSGDWRSLHQVMVKTWGEPYAPPARLGSVDATALAERAEVALQLGTVPDGVRFITAWADAQIDRWEMLVRGWGEGGESWILDYQVIPGDPAGNPVEWDRLLDRLATLALPLADGSGRVMRVRAAGFDAFGQPGVTEQAQAAWLRRRQRGLIPKHGTIEGRDAWSLVPTRGASGTQAPRIMLVYPNSQRKDRKSAWRGNVPLLVFNPNGAKDALAAGLAIAAGGAGSVHIPAGLLTPGGPPHAFLEGLAAEQRDPDTHRWTKANPAARNEPMDLMVGCEIVARLHGLHRIRWETPPGWAAPWDANTMIEVAGVDPAGVPPAAKQPAQEPAGDPPSPAAAAPALRGTSGPPPAPRPHVNIAALRLALNRGRGFPAAHR